MRRRVRSDNGDPDIFGAFLIRAMIFPFDEAAAAAVIGSDDESSLAAIKGNGLHGVPELLDKVVDFVGAMEHQVVAAGVRPVVGFTVADEEDLGMICTDEVEQRNLLQRVGDVFVVESCGVLVEIVDELLIRIEFAVIGQIPARLHGQVAAIYVEDIFVDVPGANDGDVAVEVRAVCRAIRTP